MPENKWISVKDRLPDYRTECLAYAKEVGNDKYQIINAWYARKYDNKGDPEFMESCNCGGYERHDMKIEKVSHWMPLPGPPEEIIKNIEGKNENHFN